MDLLLRRRTMMLSSKKVFAFTVNYSGKEVAFSPGSLYWDGSKFAFEEHDYDFLTVWDANHVGHFYWSKDADKARSYDYIDYEREITDKFFATDGGAIKGWTVLSKDEWEYIIDNHLFHKTVNINEKEYSVLIPDEISTSVVQYSYTNEEWDAAVAKYGLVAFPLSGYREGSWFTNVDWQGYNWSSTPDPESYDDAFCVYHRYSPVFGMEFFTGSGARSFAYPVRLVKIL